MNSIEDVRTLYVQHQYYDPFPNISNSSLNSADIRKYINSCGLIFPFIEDNLKPATYALTVGGKYIYWDSKKRKKTGDLKKGEYLTIEKDSIIFLSLNEYIQLPHYIVARFNLKIGNIYRGLLLGTGPIIDPGFCGYLSIPVHNFTSNDYIIKGGETFIWMEFTKLSIHSQWASKEVSDNSDLKYFNEKNRDRNVEDYIYEADKRPIQSSIPLSVGKSEAAAKSAAKKVQALSLITAAINFGLVLAVIIFIWSVYVKVPDFKKDNNIELQNIRDLHLRDSAEIFSLHDSIKKIKSEVRKFEKQ